MQVQETPIRSSVQQEVPAPQESVVDHICEKVELAEKPNLFLRHATKDAMLAWKTTCVNKLHIQRQCICISIWKIIPMFQPAMLVQVFIGQVRHFTESLHMHTEALF